MVNFLLFQTFFYMNMNVRQSLAFKMEPAEFERGTTQLGEYFVDIFLELMLCQCMPDLRLSKQAAEYPIKSHEKCRLELDGHLAPMY